MKNQGSLVTTLKEVRPTAFMGVPRVWEKMQEKMKSLGAKSSTVRRKLAAWAKDVGLQTNLTKMNQYVHVVKSLLYLDVVKSFLVPVSMLWFCFFFVLFPLT